MVSFMVCELYLKEMYCVFWALQLCTTFEDSWEIMLLARPLSTFITGKRGESVLSLPFLPVVFFVSIADIFWKSLFACVKFKQPITFKFVFISCDRINHYMHSFSIFHVFIWFRLGAPRHSFYNPTYKENCVWGWVVVEGLEFELSFEYLSQKT